MKTNLRRQAGATLMVTLIMLIMLTLFAVSAMNTSTINLQVVGNMQTRTEALEAARTAVEQTISSQRFINTPNNAVSQPCDGVPNRLCIDANGDGKLDYQTNLAPRPPTCVQSRIVKVNELKILSPTSDAVACLQAQQQGQFAVAGAQSSGDSLCGETTWEIMATATRYGVTAAAQNDVSFGMTQGVAVRIPAIDVPTACP